MFNRGIEPLRAHSWVASYLALFVALATGGAYAAGELGNNDVRSKHIGKGQVKTQDLANNAVTSPKVANGSLLSEDFAAGQLSAGADGAPGPVGPAGPAGPEGPAGPAGSPDTPQQVLDKLKQVDGPFSGLDADVLDGRSSSSLDEVVESIAGMSGPLDGTGIAAPDSRTVSVTCPNNGIALRGEEHGVQGAGSGGGDLTWSDRTFIGRDTYSAKATASGSATWGVHVSAYCFFEDLESWGP